MVDFDVGREARLSAFERTGGAAANGVTVRDYFAARIASVMYEEVLDPAAIGDWDFYSIASSAYAFADAMMKERDRNPQPRPTVEEAFGLDK